MNIDSVRKAYRRYAGLYDFGFGQVMHPGREAVIRSMNCQPGDRILEVGVGTGLSLPLYPRDVEVIGVDISPEMLQKAHDRKERFGLHHVTSLAVMDAEQMSYPANSFDKVVAMYVASVVPHPIKLVNEMRRVCKPEGRLYIVNHFQNTNPFISRFERLIAPFSGLLGFRPDFSLETFVLDTRLDIIEHHSVNLFGYWSLLEARNNKDILDDGMPIQATA